MSSVRFLTADATNGREALWTPARQRAARHGLWVAAVVYVLLYGFGATHGLAGFDSHAYWTAWDHGLYSAAPEQRDAFLYSPAFAQVIWPLTLLPWWAFFALWTTGIAGIYWWLFAPLGRQWAAPLILLCAPDILFGNIWSLFALVLVIGFRYPAAWTFPLLTKVTSCVGLLWFIARKEWRSVAITVGVTVGIVAVSAFFVPHLWADWLALLIHPDRYANHARDEANILVHIPAVVRLPAAGLITVVAARADRPRMLALAMALASPVFGLNALAVLAALPRMPKRSPDTIRQTESPNAMAWVQR